MTQTTTAKELKTLEHGTQIRRTDDIYNPVITVGTVAGMVRIDHARYGEVYCFTDDNTSEGWMETDLNKAILVHELVERSRGHQIVWANLHASCLTSNYPGKAAELERKRQKYESSPIIEDGERVIIEGRIYKAKYMRRDCSDCVHFIAE